MGGLTDKQAKFCVEYLIDLNGTQAAIRAGYSENTARAIASENLSKPDIVEELNRLRGEIAKTTKITPERILQEYARIGFSDVRKTLGANGELKNPQDWDDDTAASIAGVEVVTRTSGYGDDAAVEYVHKIKTWDKKAALDSMAKHLGMFDGKKGVEDPETPQEEQDLRAVGRKLGFILRAALSANDPG
jgi:phage terminase small subunit